MAKVAEIKTKENDASVEDFINSLKSEQQRKDSLVLVELMQSITNEPPKMWGNTIIGFGSKRYKSPTSGREVDWFKIGFSPRKANISLNLVLSTAEHADTLQKLGKHKTGMGCVYINKLGDIDLKVLEELIHTALKDK